MAPQRYFKFRLEDATQARPVPPAVRTPADLRRHILAAVLREPPDAFHLELRDGASDAVLDDDDPLPIATDVLRVPHPARE